MRIRVKQQELEKAINTVQKAIPIKTVIPIGRGIYLNAQDNLLNLVGNDLQIGIETYINAEVMNSGRVVIDAKMFGDIIRKIKDEYVNINVNDNYLVEIQCENLHIAVMGLDLNEFPSLPQIIEGNSVVIPENIISNMIKQTAFAVSKTQAHFITTGILLEIVNNRIIMVSTDMYRLAMRKEPLRGAMDKNIKALIPGSSLLEIGKLLSENGHRNVEIAISDRQAVFIIENSKIMVRLISGDYIKYDVAFPQEHSTYVRLKANEFLDALEITNIFTQNGNNLVRLNIKDQVLKVSAETELGNMLKEINVEIEGKNIEIGFNVRYLIEMLRVINDEEIELYLSSSILPMLIKTVGNNDYSYLVFPVRLRERNNDLEV